MPPLLSCPLCYHETLTSFHQDAKRRYLRCSVCHLVSVPPIFHLARVAEKAEYDLHENNPQDTGYRRFLSRLCTPLLQRLPPQSHGLDFGSGPGPTLSVMLEEQGHTVALYDPFYAPNRQVFEKTYDFITATEVVEHLHQPRVELGRLWTCLRPVGWLGIMTKRVRSQTAFATWHYINDPTHVAFFALETFEWLAHHWQADLTVIGDDVVLLQKPALTPAAPADGSVA